VTPCCRCCRTRTDTARTSITCFGTRRWRRCSPQRRPRWPDLSVRSAGCCGSTHRRPWTGPQNPARRGKPPPRPNRRHHRRRTRRCPSGCRTGASRGRWPASAARRIGPEQGRGVRASILFHYDNEHPGLLSAHERARSGPVAIHPWRKFKLAHRPWNLDAAAVRDIEAKSIKSCPNSVKAGRRDHWPRGRNSRGLSAYCRRQDWAHGDARGLRTHLSSTS